MLLFANVGILIGPFLLHGDPADQGVRAGRRQLGRQARARARPEGGQGGDHPRDQPLAGGRRVQEGRRQARARAAVPGLAGHRQDDAGEGDRHRVQLAVRDRPRLRLRAACSSAWTSWPCSTSAGRPRSSRASGAASASSSSTRSTRSACAANSLVGGGSSRPVASNNIHDHLFFGPSGALTASGDVTLKSSAWRERMFAEREGTPTEGGARGLFGTIGRRVRRTVDIAVPGMMGGGSGALNQLLVLMDGIDEPPMMKRMRHQPDEHHPRRAVRRAASRRQGEPAALPRERARRTTSTSSAPATSRSTCSTRRSPARGGSAGTSASGRRSSTTGSTSSTTTSRR